MTQLANSLIANYGKSDGTAAMNSFIDTKRLELAIAGSGARIKVLSYFLFYALCFVRHCLYQPFFVPPDTDWLNTKANVTAVKRRVFRTH